MGISSSVYILFNCKNPVKITSLLFGLIKKIQFTYNIYYEINNTFSQHYNSHKVTGYNEDFDFKGKPFKEVNKDEKVKNGYS